MAQAEVGIDMGTGTDVAVESAGVTLVPGESRGIARARRLSRATMRHIKQILCWAFAHNSQGVPLAAGALPVFRLASQPDHCRRGQVARHGFVIGHAPRLNWVRLD